MHNAHAPSEKLVHTTGSGFEVEVWHIQIATEYYQQLLNPSSKLRSLWVARDVHGREGAETTGGAALSVVAPGRAVVASGSLGSSPWHCQGVTWKGFTGTKRPASMVSTVFYSTLLRFYSNVSTVASKQAATLQLHHFLNEVGTI